MIALLNQPESIGPESVLDTLPERELTGKYTFAEKCAQAYVAGAPLDHDITEEQVTEWFSSLPPDEQQFYAEERQWFEELDTEVSFRDAHELGELALVNSTPQTISPVEAHSGGSQ